MRLTTNEIEQKARHLKETLPVCKVEIVGSWIWVTFVENPGKEVCALVKSLGGRWNNERHLWQISNGWYTRKSKDTDEELRLKHGSALIDLALSE